MISIRYRFSIWYSILWGALLLGVPEWLCTWAILGAKVTTPKSIVFPANDRPAGRPYPFCKGVLAYALVQKRYSLLIHRFFMSTFHIYEGMKVATLEATLQVCWGSPVWPTKLHLSAEFFKNVLKILRSMGANTRWILKHFRPGNAGYLQFAGQIVATIYGPI